MPDKKPEKQPDERDKQAVLLIHGIGEQIPMETLRRFVEAVWTTDEGIHTEERSEVWSKPDKISDNFELRRLTTRSNAKGIRTDFFEFYWAHLMTGTRLAHVLSWARVLLLRWPWRVPRPLLGTWVVLVLLVAALLFLLVNGMMGELGKEQLVEVPPWLTTVIGLALPAFTGLFVIGTIGDAARYLHRNPANVQVRQEIRKRGVELLRKLHDCGEYRRILIVGHSLGSVVGYDVLTHAWSLFNTRHKKHAAALRHERLTELQAMTLDLKLQTLASNSEEPVAMTAKPGGVDIGSFQGTQRGYLEEIQANGNPWLVTDFVTLGSPLAHAALLLARDAEDLESKQTDRELPTCPPVLEGESSFSESEIMGDREHLGLGFSYSEYKIPHHAAVFGPTRWTNLYAPARWILWGDVIGGRLAPIFGNGIRDVPVRIAQRWGIYSHTLYWRPPRRGPMPDHIHQLRRALDLNDSKAAAREGAVPLEDSRHA